MTSLEIKHTILKFLVDQGATLPGQRVDIKEFLRNFHLTDLTMKTLVYQLKDERLITMLPPADFGLIGGTKHGRAITLANLEGKVLATITDLGMKELKENAPTINLNVGNNSTVQFQQGTINSNQTIMKQSEKLDLILKELYNYKFDGKYYSLNAILSKYGIDASHMELFGLAGELRSDGYIKTLGAPQDVMACIIAPGVAYVEGDSYTHSGSPIINNTYNISLVNSNMVTNSNNVSIIQEITQARDTVNKIREGVKHDSSIDTELLNDILECLNEIDESLKSGNKTKFSIKSLISMAGDLSSVGSLVTTLAQIAAQIPV